MDMLLILLISLFILTFIGVVVGIILLIVRKERWAGIIVAGLSFGIGFYVLLAGLNLATVSLLQALIIHFLFTVVVVPMFILMIMQKAMTKIIIMIIRM